MNDAADELKARGHRVHGDARVEPWGPTIVHLLSPAGLLLGVAYTPWMHEPADSNAGAVRSPAGADQAR